MTASSNPHGIEAGQIWMDPSETVRFGFREVRIMAFADRYVMARRKGCIPFCMRDEDFVKKFSQEPW